ncbi:MAG: M23 family metallopeptidase [Firmicutes bacterium]|nr:M23 family metallopeptidase [Bacillota bacterium]
MRHAKHKRSKDRVTATIVLCFCLIALTSIFTIQASIDKINESAKNLPAAQEIATEPSDDKEEEETVQTEVKEKQQQAADLPVSEAVPVVDSAADKTAKAPACLPPVNLNTTTVSKKYSMDMVIYNKTLDQYMTHPGIDLEGPSGSGVNAIAAGTVTDVYEDDAYGTAIEITHDNGLMSKYACLESDALVEKGDVVKQGQQIGIIGKTALYESMESAHLHFELYQNGKLCNPADHIAFE